MKDIYPNNSYFSLPRTFNETYGSWASQAAHLARMEMARHQQREAYGGCESQIGITSNAEYGGFMHSNHHHKPDFFRPKDKSAPSPAATQTPRDYATTPMENYNGNGCDGLTKSQVQLPPLSYHNTGNDQSEGQLSSRVDCLKMQIPPPLPPEREPVIRPAPLEKPKVAPPLPPEQPLHFCKPAPDVLLSERVLRRRYPREPLPPLPSNKKPTSYTPRYYYQYIKDPEPKPSFQNVAQSYRDAPSDHSVVPSFPPNFHHRPDEGTITPREAPQSFRAGALQVPFSDVAAVELHLKNNGKLMLSVDELKKRYIS